MLALGIIFAIGGILLLITEWYVRRAVRLREQASLQRENAELAARVHTVESQFPQALVMMDSRGFIRRVNPAAEALFGYTEKELLGNNILRLQPFAPSARNAEALRLPQASERGVEMEVRRKNRTPIRVHMKGTRPLMNGSTDFYMFFEPVRISPQEPSLAPLERVVGRITAKFQELLTSINGYSQLALYETPEDSPLRKQLEEIVSASEEASHLTRNLAAFSGGQFIPVETLDLNPVVESAAQENSGAMELKLTAEPILVVANHECLRQVLRLLAESIVIREPDSAGGVQIETARSVVERARAVYSGELAAGSYGLIRVANPKYRLNPEVLAHLFEPLYESPSRAGPDISPIYGIVSSLGGRLHVDSSEAAGTTFEIWLPAAGERTIPSGSLSHGAVA